MMIRRYHSVVNRCFKDQSWCERRDLNPHGGYPPDPKSGASAVSPLSRVGVSYFMRIGPR